MPVENHKLSLLVALERELDDYLSQHPKRFITHEFVDKASRWSSLILCIVQDLPGLALSDYEQAKGMRLVERPVFVGGLPRSGTTLLINLLDSHPQLCCIPFETLYFEIFLPKFKEKTPEEQFRLWIKDCLQKLIRPMGNKPIWILGRSSAVFSPYVQFVVYMVAWEKLLSEAYGSNNICNPLRALSLAYASVNGKGAIDEGLSFWVEKSPYNELYFEELMEGFPGMNMLLMIREPASMLKSFSQLLSDTGNRLRKKHFLRIRYCYRTFIQLTKSGWAHPVKYEELINDKETVLDRIHGLLNIRSIYPSKATVNGLDVVANTSFDNARQKERATLRKSEMELLAVAAQVLQHEGYQYQLPSPRSVKAKLLFNLLEWLLAVKSSLLKVLT